MRRWMPYVSDMLNATMSSAALTMNGALDLATARDKLRVSYRGDATLGHVHMLDRATSESVLRWHSCSASRIDAEIGSGPPKVHIDVLALTDFDTRLILESDGRLNVLDMMASPRSAPASLTRTPAGVWRPDAGHVQRSRRDHRKTHRRRDRTRRHDPAGWPRQLHR